MNTLHFFNAKQQGRRLGRNVVTILFVTLATFIIPSSPDRVLGAPAAQPLTIPSGDAAAFLQLFPKLKTLPAPAWLHEGGRFTYAIQSANVNAAAGTGSGGGYLQYNIVAADTKSVAVMSQFYLEQTASALTPYPGPPGLALPAAGDIWLSPTVLVNAERVANDELKVVRNRRKDGAGQAHRVVRFQSTTNKMEKVWEFDEATGVLVFFSLRYGDADEPTQLSQGLLVNQRQLRLPWRGSRIPTWVKTGGELQYTGSFTSVLYDGTTTSLPYTVAAEFLQQAPRWSSAHIAAFSNGVSAGEQVAINGMGQLFGGLWLPAEALHAKPARALLDQDPVTGAEITWQRGSDRSVILTERGDAFETVLTYDGSTGVLRAYQQTLRMPAATTTLAIELAE